MADNTLLINKPKDKPSEILGNKQTVIDAMKETSFEDYIKFIPKPPLGEWQRNFIESSKKLTDKEGKNIFIISGFICLLQKYFWAFWNPWSITGKTRKLAFRGDFIDYAYEKIELEWPTFKTSFDYENDTDETANKKYYESCYGYYIAEDFLKGIDEIYWRIQCKHSVIVQRVNMVSSVCYVEFNDVSIRGRHRVKIWPTFMSPNSLYSRRAPVGRYYQLTPSSRYFFDKVLLTVEDKVKWLCGNTKMRGRYPEFIDAIHPHIANGDPCLGGWQAMLNKDAEGGYASVFMKHLKGYLSTWTAESPFWNINELYKHTYKFPVIKGRTNAHWSVLDTRYLINNWSDITRNDWEHNVERLAMQMKHETGYYTDEFFSKYRDYLDLREIDSKKAMTIISKMHDINPFHPVDNNIESRPKDGIFPFLDAGYVKIWRLHQNHWTLKQGKLPLTSRYCKINLRPMFSDLIQRVKVSIMKFINSSLDNLHWSDVMNYDSNNSSINSIVEKLSQGKKGNFDLLNDIYLNMFDCCSPDEFNKITLESDYPWEEDGYYSANILKMFNDYKYFERFLDGWIKESYSKEIERLTNLTKEFSNELTNYTSSPGQSELFPKSISS